MIAFAIFDIYTLSGNEKDVIRILVYGFLINILSDKLINTDRKKEQTRVYDEKALLQELLLKRERLSSTKLKKEIKKRNNKARGQK